MKRFLFILLCIPFSSFSQKPAVKRSFTLDSLGACQGISIQNDKYLLYGDSKFGVMRSYDLMNDSLVYDGNEYRFTTKNENTIKHPTGLAVHRGLPTFVGNSVKLNKEGTLWRTEIFQINWDGFLKTKTLDSNLISRIDDDACVQGTRPEYVKHNGKWFVATADYGNNKNEVRLYNASKLSKAKKTSENGVVAVKFGCSAWVQNLHYIEKDNVLVLIQNQVEGRKWRLTFLDLAKSIQQGNESVIKVVDFDKEDELEGFVFVNDKLGIGVSSSRKNNVSLIKF